VFAAALALPRTDCDEPTPREGAGEPGLATARVGAILEAALGGTPCQPAFGHLPRVVPEVDVFRSRLADTGSGEFETLVSELRHMVGRSSGEQSGRGACGQFKVVGVSVGKAGVGLLEP